MNEVKTMIQKVNDILHTAQYLFTYYNLYHHLGY